MLSSLFCSDLSRNRFDMPYESCRQTSFCSIRWLTASLSRFVVNLFALTLSANKLKNGSPIFGNAVINLLIDTAISRGSAKSPV